MSHRSLPGNPGGFFWGAVVLVVLGMAGPGAILLPTKVPAGGPGPLLSQAGVRAEVRFPEPVRHAIILQGGAGGERMLVARGDVMFHPHDPAQALTVERVEAGALLLREGARGQPHALQPGQPLRGFPGLTFTGTVLLAELHYRYRVVDRLRNPDPVLVALEGSRAILEVETPRTPTPNLGDSAEGRAPIPLEPPTPGRATVDGQLLESVRLKELGPELYEVPAADVHAVLENAGRVLTDLWPTVQPHLSLQTGLEYRITSSAGDGILSRSGFTVTAPKLAERAGIQVGDTIVRVNGQPVDGFGSLYRIFQAARGEPSLRTVEVELDRRGVRVTKTYRIR